VARYGEKREEAPKARDEKPYWGFNSAGCVFRSAVQVDNAVTRTAKEVMALVKAELWTPSDVVMDLSRRPEWFQVAFGHETAAAWSVLDQFYQWSGAQWGSGLANYIRNQGGAVPPWTADENAWSAECDRWERADASRESRYAHATARLGVLEKWFGGEELAVARRIMGEAERGVR
jgi:hypothetical protein